MHQTTQLRKGGYSTHRCQSKAGVSRKALILLSSSALLGGGASGIKLLDWTGTWSGIEYKSLPNSSQSESSGCQVVWRAQFPRVCISIVHKRQKKKRDSHISWQMYLQLVGFHFQVQIPPPYFPPFVCKKTKDSCNSRTEFISNEQCCFWLWPYTQFDECPFLKKLQTHD